MLKSTARTLLAALIGTLFLVGCNTDPSAHPTPPPLQAGPASTQPDVTVAELATLKISKTDLDKLLYESYGLRMMFDLIELDLAKATLAQQGGKLLPEDVQRERQLFLQKIGGDAPQSDWENLFQQALQQEHLSNSEFDVKVLQTNACLRKIVEPMVLGKMPEEQVRHAFEQLYGGRRRIADITLKNVREASEARTLLKTQSFAQVAMDLSLDRESAVHGGEWPPFTAKAQEVSAVIRATAFSLELNQVSDIITVGDNYHLIKLLEIIPPKAMKYEDVKDYVRKQMENQLVELNLKRLRDELIDKAEAQVQIQDPILAAQWRDVIQKARTHDTDRNEVAKQLDAQHAHMTATAPATTQSAP